MSYPKFWKKTNDFLAFFSGSLVMIIAIITAYEAIARRIFASPTSWTLNASTYILIWTFFLASAYAFQEFGHVSVDMLRDVVDRHDASKNRMIRRVISTFGYILTMGYVSVLLLGGYRMTARALRFSVLTSTTTPIPIWLLYVSIIIGAALMLVTLLFIVLDLLRKGDKYL